MPAAFRTGDPASFVSAQIPPKFPFQVCEIMGDGPESSPAQDARI
jgi:hypothetical protein